MVGVVMAVIDNRHLRPPQVLGLRWRDHMHLPPRDFSLPLGLRGLFSPKYDAIDLAFGGTTIS